jgi:phasin
VTANKFQEIPQAMRELAAKNIDQARAGYDQIMDAARKTQETMKTMIPPSPLAQGIHDVQERAMRIVQQNIEAGFSLANELSQAADFTEMFKIQSKHAQQQINAYSAQAQELMSPAK